MILATVGVPTKSDQTMGQYATVDQCKEALIKYKENSKKTVGRCELREKNNNHHRIILYL